MVFIADICIAFGPDSGTLLYVMTQMFVNMFTEQSKSQFACHLSMLRDNLLFVNWCHQLHIYMRQFRRVFLFNFSSRRRDFFRSISSLSFCRQSQLFSLMDINHSVLTTRTKQVNERTSLSLITHFRFL